MLRIQWLRKARLRWVGVVLAAVIISCSRGARPPAGSQPVAERPAQEPAETSQPSQSSQASQLVIYAREVQPSGLPIVWEIRKMSLNKADGSQVSIPVTDVTLKTSDFEMQGKGRMVQKLVTIAEVASGDYTGLTLVTRGVYFEDTGEPVPTEANFATVSFNFSIIAGNAKTIIVVTELSKPDAARASFKFQPQLTLEDESAAPKGKIIFVSNELSSNISVIDKALKRVVKNVYVGTKPAAMAADLRRNRLYIADRNVGVIYEMDMISQHLLRATQIEFVDEPVWIEPVPTKDLLIVVNFGGDTIYLLDAFNMQIVETLEVGDGPVKAVYSVLTERAFVVNLLDGTMSVINLQDSPAAVDTTIQVELRPSGITIDDSMGWLYVTNSGSTDLSVLKIDPKTQTLAIERTIPIGIGAGDIILDPYGRRLFVSMTQTNEILCVDPYTGVTIYSVRLPAKPGRLVFDPDEKKLYATIPTRNAVVVIDTITREIQNWIETGESPSSIAIRS